MILRSNIAINSALGALGGTSVILANFLSGVVVARALGVEGAGTVAFMVWLALFITPFSEIGTAAAVGRYVPELRGRGDCAAADQLSSALARVLLFSLTICIVAAILLIGVPRFSSWPLAVVDIEHRLGLAALLVAGYTALQALGGFGNAYLRGRQAFTLIAKLAGGSFLLQVTAVTLGTLLFGVPGAIAGYASGQLLLATVALRCAGNSTGSALDPKLRRRVGRYACYAWAANIANAVVWSRIEVLFLERSWGLEAVGFFTTALALTSLATQGPLMLTTAILPILSEQQGRSEFEAMRETSATATRLLALLVFPCCLGMAALMPIVLPLIYGKAFTPAVPAAIILVCAAAISATSVVGTNLVLAMERNDFVFISSLVGACFAVFAGFMLIPTFGVLGAATTRALIQVFLVVLGSWFITRRLHCPIPFGALARICLAATTCALAAAICVTIIGNAAAILPAIAAGAIVYLVALRLFRAVPPADLAVLKGVADMLPPPLRLVGTRLVSMLASEKRES